jgi:hypothetical protein
MPFDYDGNNNINYEIENKIIQGEYTFTEKTPLDA